MDDKLKGTIKRIVQLTQQNPEFGVELRKALGIEPSAISVSDNSVPANVQAIREALEIRASHSINYDFIKEERLNSQLYIDNLRMENAALNLKKSENERFYIFCVNAFYQIENIINYYYFKSYPNIKDLVSIIVASTKDEGEDGKYAYKSSGKEETVGDIPIASKLNTFCNTFFPKDQIKITYAKLKQVRNEGEHRCMVIIKNEEEDNSLYKFFKYNSFNTVRIILIKLVNEVKKQMEKQKKDEAPSRIPAVLPASVVETQIVIGTIKTMLPSGCFVSYNGNTFVLPSQLLKNVQGLKVNDKVKISLNGGKIVGIQKT